MKKVFLIGDSIRLGYCQTTRELLKDVAEVMYPEENCRFTQYTYVQLRGWADRCGQAQDVDLVYWNNGHWDAAHWSKTMDEPLNSPEEYARMLERVYGRIRECFPKARVVFATTTTREEGAVMAHPRSNEAIRQYNQAAREVMARLDVSVSDMMTYSETLGENRFCDGIHFTPAAFARLGEFAANEIRAFLNQAD